MDNLTQINQKILNQEMVKIILTYIREITRDLSLPGMNIDPILPILQVELKKLWEEYEYWKNLYLTEITSYKTC